MPVVAHFASRRSHLVVVERPAIPEYEGGRLVATKAGKYHQFSDHICRVEGQKSIDFLRERCKAPDGPDVWELDSSDVPGTTELLIELATADIARVREILAAEEATAARREVIDTAKAILAKAGAPERGPGAQKQGPRHELISG